MRELLRDYWDWAKLEPVRMWIATPLLALFILGVLWSIVSAALNALG